MQSYEQLGSERIFSYMNEVIKILVVLEVSLDEFGYAWTSTQEC